MSSQTSTASQIVESPLGLSCLAWRGHGMQAYQQDTICLGMTDVHHCLVILNRSCMLLDPQCIHISTWDLLSRLRGGEGDPHRPVQGERSRARERQTIAWQHKWKKTLANETMSSRCPTTADSRILI